MNSKLMSVLASVCIVCILIIIGEWFYAVQSQKKTLASIPAAETKLSHDEMPVLELTRQSEESYADMVTRPLFIKGRKPVDEPTPEEALTANAAIIFDWQLNGIYSTKKGPSALFSRSKSRVAKDNYRKIRTGADLDGWNLAEIHKDRVLLTQGSQQKELLLRKPKLKAEPKNPNVPNNQQPGISPQPEANQQPEVNPQTEVPPEPEINPQPEDIPQPAEGEFENNNEQF